MADNTEDNPARAPAVMVVDDEEYIRSSLSKMLERDGYEPVCAASGEEALELVKSRPVDVILCDYKLSGLNGIETIVEAKKLLPDLGSALITGLGTDQIIIDAFTKGRVDYYLMKPFTLHELTRVINMSLRAAHIRKRERIFNEELRNKVDEATKELREKNRLLTVREREMALLNKMLKADHERLKGLNEMLETLSITDELTGLYNFRHFTHRLSDEMTRAKRYGLSLSLLMMDLDNFKLVNDQHGHLGGDEALKRVAEMLQRSSRSTDVAARYGGEEFTLILPEVGAEGAAFRAERLRQTLSEIVIESEGARFSVTMSIGVSSFEPQKTQSPHDLINAADQALYHAKKIGKNCVVVNRNGSLNPIGNENIMTEGQRDEIRNALNRFAKQANSSDEIIGFLLERLKDVFSSGASEPFLSLWMRDIGGKVVERGRVGSHRGPLDIASLAGRAADSSLVTREDAGTTSLNCFPIKAVDKEAKWENSGVLIMNRAPSYPPFVTILLDDMAEIVDQQDERARLMTAWSGRTTLDGALRELVGETVKSGLEKAFEIVAGRIKDVIGVKTLSLYLRDSAGVGDFALSMRVLSGEAMEESVASAEKTAIAEALAEFERGGPVVYPGGMVEGSLKKGAGEVIIIPLAEKEPIPGLLALTGRVDGVFSRESVRMAESLAATLTALLHHDPVFGRRFDV
ncbi:MAG: diguanylate cyclase [Nitrospinae bacterium]|nr:diguanylate cyclase [Nitrospinota bacterium]